MTAFAIFASFIGGTFADFVPYRAIATFSAIFVITNYFCLIVTFPPFLVWYYRTWVPKIDKCRMPCKPVVSNKINHFFTERWSLGVFRNRSKIITGYFIVAVTMVVISIFADNMLHEREYVLYDNSQFTID